MKQKFYELGNLSPEETKKHIRFLDSGHIWKETEYGYIDVFSYSSDTHNGPECVVCGYSCCWHCKPNPPKCKGK